MDKITEVENSIGGEFIIEQKELLKYMDEYPFSTKFFSIKYPSGEKYSGYYSPDWVKEVFGIQIDINGNKYVGMFKNGMFEGRGRLILHKGDYYEGEFVQNKANGFGKYVNAKGEIYNGYWIDDKQEGQGELILKDGSIYQGQFKDGKKNGKGKITWSDNSYYEGDFVNNYYEGYGVYIMVNKRKGYLGQWKEGKMHGYGVFFWADGRSYKGYEIRYWFFKNYNHKYSGFTPYIEDAGKCCLTEHISYFISADLINNKYTNIKIQIDKRRR
jgi:hypothetical protein